MGGNYIGAWFLGAGLSSAFGVQVAKRVAPNFNRIGLILLMLAPIVLFAIAGGYAARVLSDQVIVAVLSALLGTAIGLGVTFRELDEIQAGREVDKPSAIVDEVFLENPTMRHFGPGAEQWRTIRPCR